MCAHKSVEHNLSIAKLFRDNFLRSARFSHPDFIPCRIILSRPILYTYKEKILEVIERFPLAFPNYDVSSMKFDNVLATFDENRLVRDVFGTVWRYRIAGLGPQPHEYPLADLDRVWSWELPDPEAGYPIGYADPKPMISWEELFEIFDKARERGDLVVFSLHHFLFQKLMDLIPLNKLLLAIYSGDKRFLAALEKVANYQLGLLKIAKRYNGIDVVAFLEDLGSQDSPLIRPQHLKKYFLPYYKIFFDEVRNMNAFTYFHSDGRIIPLANVILEAKPDILNIQDIVNGIENISAHFKGKLCIDLDIDRQHLIPYGTKEKIFSHFKEVVEKLNTELGGLMIHIEVYPPTPLENIVFLAEACYRYCFNIGSRY